MISEFPSLSENPLLASLIKDGPYKNWDTNVTQMTKSTWQILISNFSLVATVVSDFFMQLKPPMSISLTRK